MIRCIDCQYYCIHKDEEYCTYYCEFIDRIIILSMCKWLEKDDNSKN